MLSPGLIATLARIAARSGSRRTPARRSCAAAKAGATATAAANSGGTGAGAGDVDLVEPEEAFTRDVDIE